VPHSRHNNKNKNNKNNKNKNNNKNKSKNKKAPEARDWKPVRWLGALSR